MSTWSTLFNFFAVLLIMFMIMVLHQDVRENERQIQELRLEYAIDYASEGAFDAALEGGNLGISYKDLENINIVPENTLEVFKAIMLLSYDMSLSETNFSSMDSYISSAVLAVGDGYYIATPKDYTSTKLSWGLKKPYTVEYPTKGTKVAYNISSQNWKVAFSDGVRVRVDGGTSWTDYSDGGLLLSQYVDSLPTRDKIITSINNQITQDINFHIKERNKVMEKQKDGTTKEVYQREDSREFIYLPSVTTNSGINNISKPSIFITLAGVDFAGTQKIESQSVSGLKVIKKRRVVVFEEAGVKYYAYEGQIDTKTTSVTNFYNTVDEAARAGYQPHLVSLSKPSKAP